MIMAPTYIIVFQKILKIFQNQFDCFFGYISVLIFSFSFVTIPFFIILSIVFFPPYTYVFTHPITCSILIIPVIISYLLPARESITARLVGQLWYELFDFSCNMSPERRTDFLENSSDKQFIIGMHPHGIVPFQAVLWASYCHQYLKNDDYGLYGFGAAANVVQYLPFIRNFMAWLSAGSADYAVLKRGLVHGKVDSVVHRTPRNLYLLPGGIAEIFTSTPGKHTIVFKGRKGLIRLSIETGASLIPTYVFGGTDFFNNLATSDSVFSRFSRKFKIGITFFWGYLGLPIPFCPKVTMVICEPLPVVKWTGEGEIPMEMIDDLHNKYIQSIQEGFDKYKALAGYPDAVLNIE